MPRVSDSQGNELKLNPDGSIKASITGSLANIPIVLQSAIVKEESVSLSLTIAAGSNSTLIYAPLNINAEYYVLGVECLTGANKWKVGEQWRFGGKIIPAANMQTIIDHSEKGATGNLSARLPVKTARIEFIVYNMDVIDLTFRVTLQRINTGGLV